MADRATLIKRQRALAKFGDYVLRCEDLPAILMECCRLIADALGTDLAKVVEIDRKSGTGLVLTGVGWKEGVVGHARFPLTENTSEAYAIATSQPVITRDIAKERRFTFPPLLVEHGVVAVVNVPIFLPGGKPYGVLQVDAREPRDFGQEEIDFLLTYATVLGPVIDRIRKTGELRHATERFRLIVESARDYAIFLTDPDDIITDWLDGAATIFGWSQDNIVGQPAAVLYTPEDRARGVPEEESTLALVNATAPDVRWHVRKDGSRVFIDGQRVTLRESDGRVRGFMKIGQDVTERRRDQERQEVLQAELQHRVRNVLAMVRSVISRGVDTTTIAEFRANLDGRIAAMARTQALLTRSTGKGVDLASLVRDELRAVAADESRIQLSDRRIVLAAKTAEVLTLAIHELATNAIKYGGLKHPDGHLTIDWQVEPKARGDWLRLDWKESGITVPPERLRQQGFGTELITRRVPYELKGHGHIVFEPDGLHCTIAFPLVPGESILQTDMPAILRNVSLTDG